jgi:abhydrolase domain-containing protein 2
MLFLQGNTSDFHGMMTDVTKRFPATKFVCIGFSMGGNLITKYLGEEKRSKKIVAGISVCQGYDAKE